MNNLTGGRIRYQDRITKHCITMLASITIYKASITIPAIACDLFQKPMSVLDELDDKANDQLTRVLDGLTASAETQPSPERELVQFYSACVRHSEGEQTHVPRV